MPETDLISPYLGLLVGLIFGALIAYLALRSGLKSKESAIRKTLEAEFALRQSEWEDRIRQQTIEASRSVIKGRVGEQFAPLLPLFKYNPSDARFIGAPVDLVVFDGYSEMSGGKSDRPLKVVFVEVKTSKRPRLTNVENAIRRAIESGNITYEVMRIEVPEVEERKAVICPKCGREYEDGKRYCIYDGSILEKRNKR
jgi:predicted Holliday junction resolvase-like endonuclease